jgi:hypothetical protein
MKEAKTQKKMIDVTKPTSEAIDATHMRSFC